MAKHNQLGALGEALAAQFLEERGYRILRRNYRYRKAEIDIIALRDNLLCIVEVKSRRSEEFEPIAGTVGKKKVQMLVKATDHFVKQLSWDPEIRFDIITVYFRTADPEVNHLENAFYYF